MNKLQQILYSDKIFVFNAQLTLAILNKFIYTLKKHQD